MRPRRFMQLRRPTVDPRLAKHSHRHRRAARANNRPCLLRRRGSRDWIDSIICASRTGRTRMFPTPLAETSSAVELDHADARADATPRGEHGVCGRLGHKAQPSYPPSSTSCSAWGATDPTDPRSTGRGCAVAAVTSADPRRHGGCGGAGWLAIPRAALSAGPRKRRASSRVRLLPRGRHRAAGVHRSDRHGRTGRGARTDYGDQRE
jgi:hypothetical protein